MPKGIFKNGNKGLFIKGQNLGNTYGFKKGISSWNMGKKHSKETRIKIKEARRNQITTLETRKKMSKSRRGNKHWNWKGGIASVYKTQRQLIMNILEYKLWRESVFKRDNYTCIWCKKRGGKLNADHIKRFADFPELRLAIDNGRTLCEHCHRTTETYGGNKQ